MRLNTAGQAPRQDFPVATHAAKHRRASTTTGLSCRNPCGKTPQGKHHDRTFLSEPMRQNTAGQAPRQDFPVGTHAAKHRRASTTTGLSCRKARQDLEPHPTQDSTEQSLRVVRIIGTGEKKPVSGGGLFQQQPAQAVLLLVHQAQTLAQVVAQGAVIALDLLPGSLQVFAANFK